MPPKNLPVKLYAINFGVIFGAYSILVLELLYAFNYETNTFISILNLIITAAIVWYAIHLYKKNNGQKIDLTTSIKIGLAIGVIGGLIYGAYTYIHYELIQPEYLEEMKSNMRAEVEARIQRQQMSAEDAKMTRDMSSGFYATPFVLGTIGLISIVFKTFLVGLVVGLIKRNN